MTPGKNSNSYRITLISSQDNPDFLSGFPCFITGFLCFFPKLFGICSVGSKTKEQAKIVIGDV